MADTASDWGFLKLLLSLNTGLIGLVIYGYEHFSKLPYSRALIPMCLGILGCSFLLMMLSAWYLITVDTTLENSSDKPIGELPNRDRFVRHALEHQKTLNRAIWVFTIGVLFSLVYFGAAFAMPPLALKRELAKANPPTANEVFDLRTKCAQLGQKILDDDVHGPAVSITEVSNYNAQTNRCYVKLEASPADLATPRDQHYLDTSVFDGQTGELLAFTKYKNLPAWTGPGDDKHENKYGLIVYEHKCVVQPCDGYDGAKKEIESLMHDSRER